MSGDQIKKNETGQDMWHVRGRGEVDIGFWWCDLTERKHLEYIGIGRRIILKWIFSTWDEKTRARLTWIRIGTGAVEYGNEPFGSVNMR